MTTDEFNRFCRSLRATSTVIQWGGSHVWKVGGRVFAIGGGASERPSVTFKVGDAAYQTLKQQPGLRPAPYLASRGLTWIQHYDAPGLTDGELQDYLQQSHRIVSRGLSNKRRIELGLEHVPARSDRNEGIFGQTGIGPAKVGPRKLNK